MLDPLTLLVAYFTATGCLIFILLFGESPMFMNTPISKAHWIITRGLCICCGTVLERAGGQAALEAADAVADFCCGSNPLLQILYLAMVLGAYCIYHIFLFPQLPQHGFAAGHRVFGTFLVMLTVATFAAASAADPGRINRRNYELHEHLYPRSRIADEMQSRKCPKCDWRRVPRSKHCWACNCCVARWDHHCQWINNCVGLHNLRLFLAFLLCNCTLCGYGSWLTGSLILSWMRWSGVLTVVSRDLASASTLAEKAQVLRQLLRWMVRSLPVETAMLLFLSVSSLVVSGFLLYHLSLAASGTTQYEHHLRNRWLSAQLQQLRETSAGVDAAAPIAAAAGGDGGVAGSGAGSGTDTPPSGSSERRAKRRTVPGGCPDGTADSASGVTPSDGDAPPARPTRPLRCCGWLWRRRAAASVVVPAHSYDGGLIANLQEVLMPQRFVLRHARGRAVPP